MTKIIQISPSQASSLCRKITADLPEYFGLPEVNEHYIEGVANRDNFAATIDNQEVGMASIDFPYPGNANIYWMGIIKKYHSQGIGKELIDAAVNLVMQKGATTMTVETLSPSVADDNYLNTYKFYESCGFKPLFNLKPQGYEWNMVYMVKNLKNIASANPGIIIKNFSSSDTPEIVRAFAPFYAKPPELFEQYLNEQDEGERLVWLAYIDKQFTGYITLKLKSKYQPFAKDNIPEIMDLNVLPPFRNQGIASKLLDIAEAEAAKVSNIVGLGVGLYKDYGSAQKLYIKRGYIPDGNGVTYDYNTIDPGSMVCLDDDLILWMKRRLIQKNVSKPWMIR
jgi:ribosomal protein S18 acetylase RimI-like enzyme